MAKEIIYNTTKVMEPRPGKDFSTTYYQQNHQQRQATLDHIQSIVEEITEVCAVDSELKDWIQQELKGFRRTEKPGNYSLIDIVSDMAEQLESGKDIPSGMLGRWNRLFKGTRWDMEMVEYTSPREIRQKTFNRLFGEQ